MSSSSEASSPPDFPASPLKSIPTPGRFRFSRALGRWWWLATILIVAVTYTVAMIPTWMNMSDPLYESAALVEVKPVTDLTAVIMGGGSPGANPAMTRQFMNTQFEVIKSTATLELALSNKDLLHRLGGEQHVVLKRMKGSVNTTQMRGTDLIRISYRDEDPVLARDVANAVVNAYKDRRYQMEMDFRREQLGIIKTELQHKKDRVQELRVRLIEIARKAGVTWTEDQKGGYRFADIARRDDLEKQLYTAKRELEEAKIQLTRLNVVDKESVLTAAEMLKEENDYIRRIHGRYLLTQGELNALKSAGLAKEHPKIKHYGERLLQVEKLLKNAVVKEVEAKRAQLVLLENRVKNMTKAVHEQYEQGTEKARMAQEFHVARKEYQTALELKNQMEVKYDIERTKLGLPANNIIIHEKPVQADSPITRGREFVATIGVVCSLPFSIVLGIGLMYIAEMIFPRKA